jgi:hypothetical protein
MNDKPQSVIFLLFGILLATALIIAILYARQRLFTRTEPIVLAA